MKQFKYIISTLVLLASVTAQAQDPAVINKYGYKTEKGIAMQKKVDPVSGDDFKLTLETFATGTTTIIDNTKASDIILVLDVSGSMVDPYGSTAYIPRKSQKYSYNSFSWGSTYYYKHTDNNYYPVIRDADSDWWGWDLTNCRLYYMVDDTPYYLWGNDASTTESTGVDANTTIFEGVLYDSSNSKMSALQAAVCDFIDVVQENAFFMKDGSPRKPHLNNTISIVKFAGPRYIGQNGSDGSDDLYNKSSYVSSLYPGNKLYNRNTYNYTQVCIGFTPVETDDNIESLKDAVRSLSPGGATAAHYGMKKAEYLLKSIQSHDTNKTVVFFTDGEPGKTGWLDDYANAAIASAYNIKNTYGAKVFSVGVFDKTSTNITNFMDYVSSNYPSAKDMDTPGGKDTESEIDYSRDASSGGLSSIFKDIAESASKSDASVASETQVIDVISNSFEVPKNTTVDQINIYSRTIKEDGSDWNTTSTSLSKVALSKEYNLDALPPKDAEYVKDENKVGVYLYDGKLVVVGFDYSKADSDDADGSPAHPFNGNWVGMRDNGKYYGKELVIEIPIKVKSGVTGGDNTNTNMSASSGVKIATYDEDGNFTGYGDIITFPYPDADLPVNLTIIKHGLRRGESATIQIYRAPQKPAYVNGKWDPDAFDKKTGKPAPDLTNGWENFSKVILTNTTDTDGADVTKTLLCLDPKYVYRLVEDNWGWGYELDTKEFNTSEQEFNPFEFTNTLNTDAVKHAEAVSINIFGEGTTKSYKASKVQSYD